MSTRFKTRWLAALLLLGFVALLLGMQKLWQERDRLLQQGVTTVLERYKDQITSDGLELSSDGSIKAKQLRIQDKEKIILIKQFEGELTLKWWNLTRWNIKQARASEVHVELLGPATTKLPASIALPIDFSADQVSISKLSMSRQGVPLLQLNTIHGGISYANQKFIFNKVGFDIPACGAVCRIELNSSVDANQPFKVSGDAHLLTTLVDHPLNIKGVMSGNLSQLEILGKASTDVQWKGLSANHSTRIQLLNGGPDWLQMDLGFNSLNSKSLLASGIDLGLKSIDLSATLRLSTTDIAHTIFKGNFSLNNLRRLTIDKDGLPFQTSQGQLAITKTGLELRRLQIDQMHDGQFDLPWSSKNVRFQIATNQLEPKQWHSALDLGFNQVTGLLKLDVPDLNKAKEHWTFQFAGSSGTLSNLLNAHIIELHGEMRNDHWAVNNLTVRPEVQSSAQTSFQSPLLTHLSGKIDKQGVDLAIKNFNPTILLDRTVPQQWLSTTNKQSLSDLRPYLPSAVDITLATNQQGTNQQAQIRIETKHWRTAQPTQAKAQLDAKDVQIQLALNQNTWSVNAKAAQLSYDANLDKSSHEIWKNIVFSGSAKRADNIADQWLALVEQLQGNLPTGEKFNLTSPSRMSLSPRSFSMAQAQFATGFGNFTAQDIVFDRGQSNAANKSSISGKLLAKAVPLSSLPLSSPSKAASSLPPQLVQLQKSDMRLEGSASFTMPINSDSIDWAGFKAQFQIQPEKFAGISIAGRAVNLHEIILVGDVANSTFNARLQLQQREGARDIGKLEAKLKIPLTITAQGLAFAQDHALEGSAKGSIDSSWLAPWVDEQLRLSGQLDLALSVSGTLTKPIYLGTIEGKGLSVLHSPTGLVLRDGTLRARLNSDRLIIDELEAKQPSGINAAERGMVKVRGSYLFEKDAKQPAIEIEAHKFVLPLQSDQRVVISGKGTIQWAPRSVHLSAQVVADEAKLALKRDQSNELGSDVIIVGKNLKPKANTVPIPFTSTIELDLGKNFFFSGEGIKGRLQGQLNLTTNASSGLNAQGSVTIVEGQYARLGQSLKIERGRLRFAGPLDNPGLDIEAKRPNLPVDVSVVVAGSAQAPRVRLQSTTAMSDAEKLSWLALGAPLADTVGSSQSGTLAAAVAALLADTGGADAGIAQTLGLAQLGLAKNDKGTNIVSVGKRLGDRLLITYEQGLRGVWNVLRMQLQLTKQLELRVQAGTESALDLLWIVPLQK